MANIRPMRFLKFKGDCFVCLSHKLNQDGYFRKRLGDHIFMMHRFLWEYHNGPIPEGYEIHHKCNTRACCNVKHLELIEIKEHKSLTNATRYKERNDLAKEYWEKNQCSGTELSNIFNVNPSTGCRWIREWKETH